MIASLLLLQSNVNHQGRQLQLVYYIYLHFYFSTTYYLLFIFL